MRYSGKALMSFIVVLISIGVFVGALRWPIRTALFPIVTSVALFILSVAALCVTLLGKENKEKKGAAADVTFSEDVDTSVANRRALATFLWLIGFFFIIYFFGFNIAVPLFVFAYLKYYGGEKLGLSLLLAALTWVFFYGLFIQLLHTTMPDGLILQGISKLWIR